WLRLRPSATNETGRFSAATRLSFQRFHGKRPITHFSNTACACDSLASLLRCGDVDLQTLNLDPSRLDAALTPRPRMVVAVSILGNPAPLATIRAFCDAHELYFFEDNCESMGATLGGKPCGTFGDISS